MPVLEQPIREIEIKIDMVNFAAVVKNSRHIFALPRWVLIAFSITAIFGLQLAITLHKMDLPFLDGRMHYYYDNADFTFRARNGITLNEPKTQLGITNLSYSAWGKPSGEPSFYTHHPFLFKAVFQQYVRILGDAEWVSRSFALGVAAVATAGVFTGLLMASDSILAAFGGVAVIVGIPVFAIFQSCIKYEIDGMAAGTWFFAAMALYLRHPGKRRLIAVSVLAVLCALAHWTALILVLVSFVWLAWEWAWNRDLDAGRAALASGLGAIIGSLAVFVVFVWLNGGWEPFLSDIIQAASTRSDTMEIPKGAWSQRQIFYTNINFGKMLTWVSGLLSIGLAARWIWHRMACNPLIGVRAVNRLFPIFFFSTLATACIWLFAFRQGSYVHIYWQLWFCLPVAGLVAMGITAGREISRIFTVAAIIGCVALAGWLQASSYAAYRTLLNEPLGVPQDVEFLKSLRTEPFSRFVFIPITPNPLNDWFQGPIFEYYTDRHVAYFNEETPLGPGDKALILIYQNQKELVTEIGMKLGIEFANEQCGPSFCAYDVIKRQAAQNFHYGVNNYSLAWTVPEEVFKRKL